MSGNIPKTSMLTKVYYASTRTGEKTQLSYVQTIPRFRELKEGINYSALDMDEEQQAKGTSKAQEIEIPFLYTEEQWDNMKTLADSDDEYYIFFQLPEATATTANKPLTFNFKAELDLSMDNIEIDGMLQSVAKLYKKSKVEETKGFPVAG